MATTQKLGIPLIDGSDILVRQKFNEALQHIDAAALPIAHEGSKAHWPMWEPNKEYLLVNIVRTETCPEWGYLECTTAGISGNVAPTGFYGEGDTQTDGTVVWTLRRIGSGETKHNKLAGRDAKDAHPISAISGLETALNEMNEALGYKADSNDLHSHSNKNVLDKFDDDNGVPKYDGKLLIGGAQTWAAGNTYQEGNLVVYDGFLYRCIVNHTSIDPFDVQKWELLDIGYIPTWSIGKKYRPGMVVTRGNNIYRCITAHESYPWDNVQIGYWEIIAGKGASFPDWQPNTDYSANEGVVYNDALYRALSDHRSSSKFSNDMVAGSEKWKPISATGTAGALRQVTYLGVVAPAIKDIIIPWTNTFLTPPVECLKFNPGVQDQVYTACTFDNADADDFLVDGVSGELSPWVTFDGTMRPKTVFALSFSTPTALGAGKESVSEWIDHSIYKSVASIVIS